MMRSWGVSDSLKLYNIENWGDQYFSINPTGNMTIHPRRGDGPGIDLMDVIEEAKSKGLQLPLLVRFQDIIRNRVVAINEAFKKATAEFGYQGRYQGVYPIKANQMREVVEEIVDAGRPYDYGLEAGSKGELAAVVNMNLSPNALILCNGFKDYAFIKTALMAKKLGKNVIIIVEKLSELYQIIAVSKELGIAPKVGMRTKLYTKGSGKWESSGGEFAKFGLTTPELLHAVHVLRKEGLEDCFKLLHFHIGSQITDIKTIKDAVKEGARVYAKLRKMGLNVEYLDVGGGLGVDYDGSRTSFESSMNYSLNEYASDVVYSIQEVCVAEEVPEPNIVSESGRAIVAHHSVLILNVFGSIQVGSTPIALDETSDEDDVVKEMRYLAQSITPKNMLKNFNDALQRKEEALSMFKLGFLSLEDRAKVEHLFWQICKVVRKASSMMKYIPDEVETLNKQLADQYLCNFSLFQSVPDHWAIRQLFPIVPLHRHDEAPGRSATLVDITCDSDGKICQFIDLRDIKETLPLHHLKAGEPYYVGIFLMGAYQDVMGDLHNLFGKVNEVHVFLDDTESGGYYIEETIKGSDIAGVLSWIQYSATDLAKRMKEQIDAKVRDGVIKPREGVEFQDFYESLLNGYTYIDAYAKSPYLVNTIDPVQQPPMTVEFESGVESTVAEETLYADSDPRV